MRTSHLAENYSTKIPLSSSRVAVAALVLSLVAIQAHAVAAGGAATGPTRNDEIKITAALGTAKQGQAFHGTISASGKSRFYTFSITSGALPQGLTLHPNTGVISGAPAMAGTSNFTVRALSANHLRFDTLGLRLTVAATQTQVTVTVTPATATVASGANQQLTASVSGGTTTTASAQVTWSASAGTVSSTGLFTAPNTSVAASATVSATSVADPTAFALAVISITPVSSSTLKVSTSALPNATQGASYSSTLAASGGTLPYTWRMASGSLPAGLSLTSAGAFTGSPTNAGTSTFTAQVTDAASHSATASLTLTVDLPSNGKFDGPAELPRVYLQTALANTPAPGKTWLASDSAGLQSALNASACGDTVSLKAGTTFSGTFSFPGKSCDDQHWIIVRTSAPDSSLPAEGTRISPCFAGVASLPGRPAFNCTSTANVMAKLLISQNYGSGPVTFLAHANHYRFIGLEITRLPNAGFIGNLAFPASGATADHIIFDRVWMHGTAHDDTTRGIYLSGMTYAAVVDSYLNDFHCESKTGSCTDAQAISGGLGSSPGGPYKIVNNFLESSGENVLFGGGGATVTPADIEVRHNHLFKPIFWMQGRPGMVGGNHGNPFIVKNHFELKNAQRVLFEGNVAENTWGGYSQTGFSLLLTPKNQGTPRGPVCPICQVTDVTVRFSTFSHVGGGFQIANAIGKGGGPQFAGTRYSIHDVVLDDINATAYAGQGQLAQVSSGPTSPLLGDVQLNHITAFPSNMIFDIGNSATGPKMPNFMFANSIVTSGPYPVWGIGGGAANCAYNINSPVNLLTNCFVPYTFSSNVLIGVPSRWPASTWPSGNTLMSNGNSVGFVNFNNGNGGNYHLTSGSPYKAAGSDGKDLGADMTALDAATAGAY